jgi:hypothetical protein
MAGRGRFTILKRFDCAVGDRESLRVSGQMGTKFEFRRTSQHLFAALQRAKRGGPGRTRTFDLRIMSPLL